MIGIWREIAPEITSKHAIIDELIESTICCFNCNVISYILLRNSKLSSLIQRTLLHLLITSLWWFEKIRQVWIITVWLYRWVVFPCPAWHLTYHCQLSVFSFFEIRSIYILRPVILNPFLTTLYLCILTDTRVLSNCAFLIIPVRKMVPIIFLSFPFCIYFVSCLGSVRNPSFDRLIHTFLITFLTPLVWLNNLQLPLSEFLLVLSSYFCLLVPLIPLSLFLPKHADQCSSLI